MCVGVRAGSVWNGGVKEMRDLRVVSDVKAAVVLMKQ